MKTEYLLIGGVLLALYLYSKKNTAANSTALAQTNPAAMNPNTGIANQITGYGATLNQGVQALNAGISSIKGIAGLGSGSTPGKTVGVAVNGVATSVSSGNASFDNQDELAQTSGSDMAEYDSEYLGGN